MKRWKQKLKYMTGAAAKAAAFFVGKSHAKRKTSISQIAKKSFGMAMMAWTMFLYTCPVFVLRVIAAITGKFDDFYDQVAAVIQAIGAVILVWGAFEFGNSMQQQEGGATTRALQRVGGGLVMLVAPTIATAMIG